MSWILLVQLPALVVKHLKCPQDNLEYLSGIWQGEIESQRHRDFHASIEVRLRDSHLFHLVEAPLTLSSF